MSIEDAAIHAMAARAQAHADKSFDIVNDLLVELYDDDGPVGDTHETLYNLLVEAEEGLQWVCRRLDEAAGIAGRKARR